MPGMLTETMQGSFASTVAGSLLIVCACAGAFAAGLPLLVMPAPLVAASGLVLWFESGQLRDYAIFFAGAMLTAAWFLNHHFVFLEVGNWAPECTSCSVLTSSPVMVVPVMAA